MSRIYKTILVGGALIFMIVSVFLKEDIFPFHQKSQNLTASENSGKDGLSAAGEIASPIQTDDGQPDIADPKKSQDKKTGIEFDLVTDKMKDIKLSCRTASDIPENLRQKNVLCQNIYQTDPGSLREKVRTEKPDRLVFYGSHVIYDCPAKSDNVDNLESQCYQSAKFMDDYQYGKMMRLFGVKEPEKKLFVYFADTQAELDKLCNADAVACYDGDNHIFLPLGEKGTRNIYLQAGEESVYGYGTKKKGELYEYAAISPDNCETPSLLFHEITHYFNHLGAGEMSAWIDESVARIAVDRLVKDICPPGITYTDVKKSDGEKVDKFDFNADDQVTSMVSDFWEGNKKRLDYLLGINRKIRDQGLSYFHDLYYAMKGNNNLAKSNTG